MKRYILYAIIPLLAIVITCKDEMPVPEVAIDPERVAHLLDISEDTLLIEGRPYILTAYLHRNFMPVVTSPVEPPLFSVNYLVALDSLPVSGQLEMIRQYVINEDSIWIAEYVDGYREEEDFILARVSNFGPTWEPGRYVTVVVELKEVNYENLIYIKAEDQRITASY